MLPPTEGISCKIQILTRKQMFRRLPIALTQVQAGSTSEKLLNETCQTIKPLYRAKEIVKEVYNNTIISIEM